MSISEVGASVNPTTLQVIIENYSSIPLSFTAQLVTLVPATPGTSTLQENTSPISVDSKHPKNRQVSVTLSPACEGDAAIVTLQLDGQIGGTAFSMVQTLGVTGSGPIIGYHLPATWPLTAAPVLGVEEGINTLTLTVGPAFALLPATKWSVDGTVVKKNDKPFFARGVGYSPTAIGGTYCAPTIGDGSPHPGGPATATTLARATCPTCKR